MALNLSALKSTPIKELPVTLPKEKVTPLSKLPTKFPEVGRFNFSALLNIPKTKVRDFFEPIEKVRVRDVLREAGILTKKVFKAVTPTEEDIYNKEDFEKRGIGITRYGDVAFKNPQTGKITFIDTLAGVGALKDVGKEGIEKVAKEFSRVIRNKKLDKKIIEIVEKRIIPKTDTQALRATQLVMKDGVLTKVKKPLEDIFKPPVISHKVLLEAPQPIKNIPTVIQGETFTLGTGRLIQPTTKELKTGLKAEIKATKKEIKLADTAQKKAERLEIKQRKIRTDTLENIDRQRGNTEIIIKKLKKKYLSDEDIANVVLEDGTKLTDTLKVKRNKDKSLAAIIKKSDVENIKASYTTKIPKEKWVKIGVLERTAQTGLDIGKLYELPQVWFERKGLNKLYEPVIEAGRGAEVLKNSFIDQFKEAGLWKTQGWFTADRFNLSSKEAEGIGKYFLSRQNKGYNVVLTDLSSKAQKFVKIFDNIIKETEFRFFEIAKKNGKTPRKVKNYAPIMTREDIELIDKKGAMDFIFRKHPSFFSLKERTKKVSKEIYETDYREVATRWMDGISEFLNLGEITPELKYLIDSDQFKKVVTERDYSTIHKWLKDIVNPKIPETTGGQAVDLIARLLRKGAAFASLGLNYASVVKQALTQIPIMIIEKARPKLKSQFAEAFGIDVKKLPSITRRKGDIAITDLQGKVGRIFTGALTEFDRKNAQLSLNGLLDKFGKEVFQKWEKTAIMPSQETINAITKIAQDKTDLWYGGFLKGQRPEAFRSSLGQFVNMFIYPLTSQLNGFYRHILTSKGFGKTAKATAEVMAAATAIAYLEVAISKLSFEWSDEVEMTKDVVQSLGGNIPIVSQISYAMMNDQQLQVSAGISGINNLLTKKIPQYLKGEKEVADVLFAGAEIVGLPKQIRRIKEGIEIIIDGGITDKKGKMLVTVKEVDEIMRSILRGRYGSLASQDWIRNIGEKKENRRWFVPQVEFLQNSDYNRKAELYRQFTLQEQKELRSYLSETQQKKLDKALSGVQKTRLEDIFQTKKRKSLEEIFK